MDYPSEIVFTKERCGEKLWDMVKQQLEILCSNDYIATIFEEETGIIVIRYSYADQTMGCKYPYWLTEDEYYRALSQNDE